MASLSYQAKSGFFRRVESFSEKTTSKLTMLCKKYIEIVSSVEIYSIQTASMFESKIVW